MKDILSKLLILVLLLGPLFTFAQTPTFSVKQTPTNPGPGDGVSFFLSSIDFNIDLAEITWAVDGKVVVSDVGRKNFSFTAPANGVTTSVLIEVTPPNLAPIKKNITITPSSVDMLWQAMDSRVPPFYRGKALPSGETQVRVVAIPNVKSSNSSFKSSGSFVYNWRKDGTNVAGQSGLGKNSFTFAGDILDQNNRIDVMATDGGRSVNGSILINKYEPEILFYESDGRSGLPMYQSAFGSSRVYSGSRLSLVAEPYFVSKYFKENQSVETNWYLNGQKVNTASKENIVINTGTTTGAVNVNFEYINLKKLFSEFKASTTISIIR